MIAWPDFSIFTWFLYDYPVSPDCYISIKFSYDAPISTWFLFVISTCITDYFSLI